ncbi:TylF/MycF/NovP-related O-methyltransferase [Rheinheimera aquimaris]|uniref:TylF/MycF/NovP-related O-methyltransferase n=1 Tax=Rheinheimera aquimaris TaxID=412437 RepID=UPI001E49742C|nr:TylF/MycF/NovP-related O-methyltransferase [Rheinheimera aquimaris]MCD1599746.1 TylF/MycF family methyltransferase [Rheinheimera aquimaris]
MNDIYNLFKQTRHPIDVSDYWHIFNMSNSLNVVYWNSFFEMARNIPGDIVECGVGRGRSLITILSLESFYRAQPNSTKRKIFALDSFEGFPEPTLEDQSPRNPKKGEWSISPNKQFNYSPKALLRIIENCEVPNSTIQDLNIIKGFFSDTINHISSERIAILHLDGDLYQSVKVPLFGLADKVVPGGIVIIDDYLLVDSEQSSEPFPGARLAVEEFLNSRDDFYLNKSIRGTPYLVKKIEQPT